MRGVKNENKIADQPKPAETNIAHKKELKSTLDFTKTWTDHITVWIIKVLGSMRFLVGCLLFFTCWIGVNLNLFPFVKPFDPFPFSTLEMLVSIFAIVLSVSVLINQNRQGKMEKIRQQVEFEVNVRAEHEITKVLNMLHDIQLHIGIADKNDKELAVMKESTDLQQIHNTLNDAENNQDITLP